MKHGDFTNLADDYGKYRPTYSPFVIDAFVGMLARKESIVGADIGAGTGILSRLLAEKNIQVLAIEPNTAMREVGKKLTPPNISCSWHAGSAEQTDLAPESLDFVTMASSFHWPDYNKAVTEFHRILKPDALFMALWNTRYYESNPLLCTIENKLRELVPHLKRMSSGRSAFCEGLLEKMRKTSVFSDVIYIEGRHVEHQSPEHYMGLWRSVNDVRVQAGEECFTRFMDFIADATKNMEFIEAEYTTRAWIARKKM